MYFDTLITENTSLAHTLKHLTHPSKHQQIKFAALVIEHHQLSAAKAVPLRAHSYQHLPEGRTYAVPTGGRREAPQPQTHEKPRGRVHLSGRVHLMCAARPWPRAQAFKNWGQPVLEKFWNIQLDSRSECAVHSEFTFMGLTSGVASGCSGAWPPTKVTGDLVACDSQCPYGERPRADKRTRAILKQLIAWSKRTSVREG